MGKHDGKVTICTAIDNSDVERDMKEVSGEFGGLKKVLNDMSRTISGAMSKPVSAATAKIKKEIDAAQKKVEKYQKQIKNSEASRMPLVEQAAQLGVELDEAKAKLAELQAQQQAAGNILAGNGNVEAYIDAYAQKPQLDADVIQQQAKVDALQKQWDAVNDKVDGYSSKIDQANQELATQKTVVSELEEKLEDAEKETRRIRKNAAGGKKEFGAMGKAVNSFSHRLKSIALGALIFNGISAGLREFTSYLSETLKTNKTFTKELARLKGALLTAFQPVYNAIAPAIIYLIRLLTSATLVVAEFFAKITGTTIKGNAAAAESLYEEANAIGAVGKAAKKAGKSVAGFDELNVLQSKGESTGASGSSSKNDDAVVPDFSFDGVREGLEAILGLVGLIGTGMLAWKLFKANTKNELPLKAALKETAAQMLVIAGLVLLVTGYCDGWVNGVDWGNLLITLGGIAAILGGLYIKFGSLGLQIGAVAAGIALMVLGVKDFIDNGPSLQNTIMIIGGAIALAVGLATMGIGPLIAAIIGAVAAVVAFTAAILLEEPAIMSTKEAQEQLTAAKQAATEAENSYISAVDAAESAMKRLEKAEDAAGVTGAELYKQVQDGTLDYADMTDAQKEVYKAYLDNEQKQKDLAESTKAFNDAKKAETIASYENQLALAKESGNYDEFKKSVVAAFEAGELSAEECRDLLSKSMSEMSTDSQKTFMEDIPDNIKDGLNPDQYETTRKKIGDFFRDTGKAIAKWFTDYFWKGISDWWNTKMAPIFTKKFWSDKFNSLKEGAKAAFNGVMGIVENAINSIIKKINTLSWNIPDWVPVIGGGKFGFNFKTISIPRLAQGAVIPPNKEFMAILGDQKHGTNIEAPLATIQEAVALVMQDQTSAILAGFEASVGVQKEILEAVLGIQIGDDVIGNAVARYSKKQAVIRGGAL